MAPPRRFNTLMPLPGASPYEDALDALAKKLGQAAIEEPMPISKFKSDYSGLLREALSGHLSQLSRNNERFLLLSERQVIALAAPQDQVKSLSSTLAGIDPPGVKLDLSQLHSRSAREMYSIAPRGQAK